MRFVKKALKLFGMVVFLGVDGKWNTAGAAGFPLDRVLAHGCMSPLLDLIRIKSNDSLMPS
jgi:hypothetical protein